MGSTTTGSAFATGMMGGMTKGLGQLGGMNAPREMTDRVLFVYGDPKDVVTAHAGSQLAYDVENNNIYMAVAQNGSDWSRLGSLT